MFKKGDTVVRVGAVCHPSFGVGAVRKVVPGIAYKVTRANEAGLCLEGFEDYIFDASKFNKLDVTGGRKDDSGKLDTTLLDDMPNAIKAVVQVMQWAINDKKPVPYGRGSWQGVSADRYRAAIMRHMLDAAGQHIAGRATLPVRHQRDKETELLHLAHVACSALMALEITIRELESKDAVQKD